MKCEYLVRAQRPLTIFGGNVPLWGLEHASGACAGLCELADALARHRGGYQRSSRILIPCMRMSRPYSTDLVAAELRREIAKQEGACGCELGSIFTFVALALFVFYLAVHDPDWSAAGAFGRGVLWVVGSSVVGKLLGLAWAHLRVTRLRAELHRTLTPRWRVPDLGEE